MPYKKWQLYVAQFKLKCFINNKDKIKRTLLGSKRQPVLVKLYKTHTNVRQTQARLSAGVSGSVQ